jgi:hypothetical protein
VVILCRQAAKKGVTHIYGWRRRDGTLSGALGTVNGNSVIILFFTNTKTEAVFSSEKYISACKISYCHEPKDHSLNTHSHVTLKIHIIIDKHLYLI